MQDDEIDPISRAIGEWVFYTQNHSGQFSDFYAKACEVEARGLRLGAAFSASKFFDVENRDYEDAREVYRLLCEKHGLPDPFRVLIAVERGGSYAPGCFIICRVLNPEDGPGRYDWDERDGDSTILVQGDTGFPGLATTFGWPGEESDIEGAIEFLDACVNNAKVVEDPGYFDNQE
jgi:hypothetical protein